MEKTPNNETKNQQPNEESFDSSSNPSNNKSQIQIKISQDPKPVSKVETVQDPKQQGQAGQEAAVKKETGDNSSYNVSSASSSSNSRPSSSHSSQSSSSSSSSNSRSRGGDGPSQSRSQENESGITQSSNQDSEDNEQPSRSKKRSGAEKAPKRSGNHHKNSEVHFLQQIQEIHRDYKDNGTLFEDHEFPPLNENLFKSPEKIKTMSTEYKNYGWYRPSEIDKNAEFCINPKNKCDLKVGSMSDGVFAGALAMISIHPQIERLMVDVVNMKMGYAAFQFFKNGEWQYVLIDTRLPYSEIIRSHIFTECMESKEFWAQLVEKAYAKLNGSYENIQEMDIKEVLVDLTGGVAERVIFSDDQTYMKEKVYPLMEAAFKNHFILGCIKRNDKKNLAAKDLGEKGILENHYHGMMGSWEFPEQDDVIRLIKIRNYWGVEGNWSGDWCNHGEDWDQHKEIREALLPDQKSKGKDDQDHMLWFLKFEDWCKEFNRMIICKVFPKWKGNYSIPGTWANKSAGGKYPELYSLFKINNDLQKKVMKTKKKRRVKRAGQIQDPTLGNNVEEFDADGNPLKPKESIGQDDNLVNRIKLDTDHKWFNNPQYRIKVSSKTKIVVSLMQRDYRETNGENNYEPVDFILVKARQKNNRIWTMPSEDQIVMRAYPSDQNFEETEIERESTKIGWLAPAQGANFGYYILIPNHAGEIRRNKSFDFWLRIFSSKDIEVEQFPETNQTVIVDTWSRENHGGQLYEGGEPNPHWCQNPQYFLNFKKRTYLKIVLERTGRIPMLQKDTVIGIGLTKHYIKEEEYRELSKALLMEETHAKGDPMRKFMLQTQQHLKPPKLQNKERKLVIAGHDMYFQSTYTRKNLGALYFNFLPIEGPFIIVPSISKNCDIDEPIKYRMTIYSNNDINVEKLDDSRNIAIVDEWDRDNAGGCHLYTPENFDTEENTKWNQNPHYLLRFTAPRDGIFSTIKLKLVRQKKSKALEDAFDDQAGKQKQIQAKYLSVGTMISIYVMPVRRDPTGNLIEIKKEDLRWHSKFVPSGETELSIPFGDMDQNTNEFIVMPATYFPGITKKYIISVNATDCFTFEKIEI